MPNSLRNSYKLDSLARQAEILNKCFINISSYKSGITYRFYIQLNLYCRFRQHLIAGYINETDILFVRFTPV